MIDTDKYEGHTPAEHWDFSIWGITMPTGFDTDAQLIQDAPLLLEEVKRLREIIGNREWTIKLADEEIKRLKEMLE